MGWLLYFSLRVTVVHVYYPERIFVKNISARPDNSGFSIPISWNTHLSIIYTIGVKEPILKPN